MTSCSQAVFTLLHEHSHLHNYISEFLSSVSVGNVLTCGWMTDLGQGSPGYSSDVQQTRVMLRCRRQAALWKLDCEIRALSPSCNSCKNLCKWLTFLGFSLANLFCNVSLPRVLAWGFTLEKHIHFVSCPPSRQTSQGITSTSKSMMQLRNITEICLSHP